MTGRPIRFVWSSLFSVLTYLVVAGLAVVLQTSGYVVSGGIGGVGQLLPEAPVNVLLHKGVDEKTGESVQSHYRLHEEKTLHLPQLDYCLRAKNNMEICLVLIFI